MGEQDGRTVLAVLGAGTMGLGITSLAVGHGVPVVLVETDRAKVGRAREAVAAQLRMARLMRALPEDRERGELLTTTSLADVADVSLVVEAVTEELPVKAEVLAGAAALTGPRVPLVSNTSSIPIDELAGHVPDPARLIGTHFMNPPYLIPTVEVVRGARTGADALETLVGVLGELARTPVVVGDGPGFVTSRIVHPMINDAIRVVQEGTASVEAVDALMQDCLGHRTGPLLTADLIGLDNLADSLRVLAERTGDPRSAPCELLLRKVRDGHLGRKSGRGFYDYGKAQL
ncbi:3-hydroxyacyl-CoA dehydrogenase family protein [Actinosynnema pretiosum subsp. pretiosum]|uniref:3-hydroxyacyl-CoA dehydrogenase family protein n=1 Tax=Actinosynnema pretiosum subsp. pretiosum TaxID=103721 RepID=B5A9R3_9PSEU|nr:MbcK [Actinosynnema pretiosum subsp. pretiosum]AXX30646.1 3-hydroxybutyryl-CoA dehydrogenase [Actinosynnema pretiosum subsp. pretiosum]QUF05226.1 3-hydroxyacyl-CoA dehydrogenase family protein [Actinosynnema pretiosum subsp. pretiosum]